MHSICVLCKVLVVNNIRLRNFPHDEKFLPMKRSQITMCSLQSVVAIGAPGLNNFQGSGFLYQVNDTSANIVRGTFTSIIDGDTQYESKWLSVCVVCV